MTRRLKSTALEFRPANDTELDTLLARIGQAQGRVNEATARADQEKSAIDEALAVDTADDTNFIKSAQGGVTAYVEANRERLTPEGKKTITLKSGTVEYRGGRLSITVRKIDDVVAGLEALGLNEFVHVKKTVNKEALLQHVRENGHDSLPDVQGLMLKQGKETLEIKPNQTLEEVGNE